MYSILAFLTKKPGLSTAEFIDYYENHHVPLINSMCGPENMPRVYKRRYTHRESDDGVRLRASVDANGEPVSGDQAIVDFDVVTEIVFEDGAAQQRWSKSLDADKVVADELRFLDRGRSRAHVVEEFVTCG